MRCLFRSWCPHATPRRAGRPDGGRHTPPGGERKGASRISETRVSASTPRLTTMRRASRDAGEVVTFTRAPFSHPPVAVCGVCLPAHPCPRPLHDTHSRVLSRAHHTGHALRRAEKRRQRCALSPRLPGPPPSTDNCSARTRTTPARRPLSRVTPRWPHSSTP